MYGVHKFRGLYAFLEGFLHRVRISEHLMYGGHPLIQEQMICCILGADSGLDDLNSLLQLDQ